MNAIIRGIDFWYNDENYRSHDRRSRLPELPKNQNSRPHETKKRQIGDTVG